LREPVLVIGELFLFNSWQSATPAPHARGYYAPPLTYTDRDFRGTSESN
jgi:hypothetical protein